MSGRISEGTRKIGNIPHELEIQDCKGGKATLRSRGIDVALRMEQLFIGKILPYHPSTVQRMDISERSKESGKSNKTIQRHNKTSVMDSCSAWIHNSNDFQGMHKMAVWSRFKGLSGVIM